MMKSLKRNKLFATRKMYVVAILFAFLTAGIGVAVHHGPTANAVSCNSNAFGGAIPGNTGLSSRQGYFTNKPLVCSWSGSSFVITSGVMTSTTSISGTAAAQSDAKTKFITQIENYYNAGQGGNPSATTLHNALGAAFVIQTMRGNYPHGSSTVTAADLADFESRINNTNVVMSIDSTCATSADDLAEFRPVTSGANAKINGHNAGGDISFVINGTIDSSNCRNIVFKVGGSVVYKLRELCANAFGKVVKGLPDSPYKLAPSISIDQPVVEPGADVNVTPTVNNTGGGSSSGTTWQIATFNLPAGAAVPAANTGSASPCAYLTTQAATGCQVEGTTTANGSQGAGSFKTGSPASFTYSSGATYGVKARTISAALGSRVCYVLSVNPMSSTSNNWSYSTAVCLLVAYKPKVQIIGGDLRVGAAFSGSTAPAKSNILTSITIKTGKSYGSWDEYGIIASGTVTGMASGSALSGGLACVGSTCQTNTLTFTNQTTPIGNYTSSTTIPDVASSFPISSSTPPYVDLSDAALTRVETGTGTLTVGGGTILKGQWLVINAPKATVNITGDINYDSTSDLKGINDIPQLVIIANQINIAGNVQNVDAWLIASGTSGIINTCSDVLPTAPLTSDICNNKLLVNGPVMAKQLYLRRTYPSTADSDAPGGEYEAEEFNLRPDAYLWATFRASQSARLETSDSQELPPRF